MLNDKQIQGLERQAVIAALFKICDPRDMENLNNGDTVQLKSGGPIMTIHSEAMGGGLFCQWFDKEGVLKSGTFKAEQLKKAEPREPDSPPTSHSMRTY